MEYESVGYADKAQQAVAAKSHFGVIGGSTLSQNKSFDRCIADASNIRDQIAECSKIAATILDRFAGGRPENESADSAAKTLPPGGAVGELTGIQNSTFAYLADLRRTLE